MQSAFALEINKNLTKRQPTQMTAYRVAKHKQIDTQKLLTFRQCLRLRLRTRLRLRRCRRRWQRADGIAVNQTSLASVGSEACGPR